MVCAAFVVVMSSLGSTGTVVHDSTEHNLRVAPAVRALPKINMKLTDMFPFAAAAH